MVTYVARYFSMPFVRLLCCYFKMNKVDCWNNTEMYSDSEIHGNKEDMDCPPLENRHTFTLEQCVTLSVICTCVVPLLLIALRAVCVSSKLPSPFKTICLYMLILDVILAVGTGIEPWLMYYTSYDRDIGDLGILLVNTVTMIMTVERVSAVQFPLKYIACSSNFKLTVCITTALLITETILYALCRLLPCYIYRDALLDTRCEVYLSNFMMGLQLTHCTIAASCFALVVYQMTKIKRTHTRRITRMGLPLTYASNATDAHISAILFTIFPTMLFIALFCILSTHRCILNNAMFLSWCSVVARIVMFTVHGLIFNFWFDEGRLHLLTMLSPFGASLRHRADEMRIQVYNIVIALAFEQSSRNSINSSGPRRSRVINKISRTSVSRNSPASLGKERPSTTVEKFNGLENLEEADTAC